MNKILVEVILPVAGQTFEVYIPLESKLQEVADLLAVLLGSLAENEYQPTQTNIFCHGTSGVRMDMNLTVAEEGLMNGSRIFLV
ncbi:MAG: hypothetical protein FWG40_12690 [Peptococcaceae bacterium]|nr:hypothetical protein [Peptococcaceae bacterium]